MKLYRYEDVVYADMYEDFAYSTGHQPMPKVELRSYEVTATTPRGVWIGLFGDQKWKWVSSHSVKRFAHPTREAALDSFIRRKKACIRIYAIRLKRAESALDQGLSLSAKV